MIALGMGLHNLGEGLAIGASYANGEWVLSAMLVAGFALLNGTEGFGIVAAAGKSTMTASDVLQLGLLAGAPTCLGAVLSGQGLSSYFTISAASASLMIRRISACVGGFFPDFSGAL